MLILRQAQHRPGTAGGDATRAGVAGLTRALQRLAPLGEPSGEYGDGLSGTQIIANCGASTNIW